MCFHNLNLSSYLWHGIASIFRPWAPLTKHLQDTSRMLWPCLLPIFVLRHCTKIFDSFKYMLRQLQFLKHNWSGRNFWNVFRSAEKRKKIEEHYIAEQDLAEARRRREERAVQKREEQQKVCISYSRYISHESSNPVVFPVLCITYLSIFHHLDWFAKSYSVVSFTYLEVHQFIGFKKQLRISLSVKKFMHPSCNTLSFAR